MRTLSPAPRPTRRARNGASRLDQRVQVGQLSKEREGPADTKVPSHLSFYPLPSKQMFLWKVGIRKEGDYKMGTRNS